MPGPMDSVLTFQSVSMWLHRAGTYQVSHFDFMRLADLCRYNLDSSASMAGSMDPTATFRNVPVWLRGAHAFEVS